MNREANTIRAFLRLEQAHFKQNHANAEGKEDYANII